MAYTILRVHWDGGALDITKARLRFIAAMVLYGTIGPMTRFIDIPSEVVVLLRGVVGTLFVLLFMRIRGIEANRDVIRSNLALLLISGATLGLNWVFLFAAYSHTTVAIASLCNYMAPIVIIALSPFLFGEKLGPKRLACVVAAVVGILLVSDLPSIVSGEVNLTGIMLGFASAACFVIIVICNKLMAGVSGYDRVLMQLGASAIIVLPYVLLVHHGIPLEADLRSWVLAGVLCLVQTGFAYVLYFSAMGDLPAQEVALMSYIEPALSVLGSALILHEPLGIAGTIGAVMIIAAAAVGEVVQE